MELTTIAFLSFGFEAVRALSLPLSPSPPLFLPLSLSAPPPPLSLC